LSPWNVDGFPCESALQGERPQFQSRLEDTSSWWIEGSNVKPVVAYLQSFQAIKMAACLFKALQHLRRYMEIDMLPTIAMHQDDIKDGSDIVSIQGD
jgi:hypothetical protein